jgi:NAD+ kinase
MKNCNPTRKLRRVLVVVKKTTYQLDIIETRDPRLAKLLADGNEAAVRMRAAHAEHVGTLDAVERALSQRGIDYKCIERGQLSSELEGTDLVITIGGDGTFLDASHSLTDIPILGVNSAPSSSHGHWCICTGDDFEDVLWDVLQGQRNPVSVMRLSVFLNGNKLPEPVLNEVLFCNSIPAGTSRYLVQVDDKREDQRSSGILIGPAAGSTGFMRSAGGRVLSATAQQFQFLVREPCIRPGENWALKRGVLRRDKELKLMSIMTAAKLFIDGANISYDVPRGDELTIKAGPDLTAFIDPSVNDRYRKRRRN